MHAALGGDAALARLRERLRARGLKLMLDFVPNHVALDHPWVDSHPEFFITGSAAELEQAPQNWCRHRGKGGTLILAHGRDPYFDGWPDTLQLNYAKAQLQQAMIVELQRIAGQCDGLRCDMAMLLLPEVFERTWGRRSEPFWPKAIAAVRHRQPQTSASWPRSTGTWNGRCSSRASTTPTTSACTTACRRCRRSRCASTCVPAWTTRTAWRAFWRTTTSRARPAPSRRRCMPLRR